ncbi:MAG: PDZ domain-containing protein [Pyrinomonadaceae bacterium]
MIRRSFALILFVLIGAGAVNSQTPEPKAEKERGAVRSFAWTMNGSGGYLGVRTEEISKDNFGTYALAEVKGVGIESVVADSPAQAAGLQKGDVIVRLNGEEVTSARKLSRLVGEIAPDHQARLIVLRGGSEREITVTVGKNPGLKSANGAFQWSGPLEDFDIPGLEDLPNLRSLPRIESIPLPPGAPNAPMAWSFGSSRQIGVGISMLTKQLADHFGVAGGALINNVRADSPAAKAGLKAGDIIVEADGKMIDGSFDLVRAIREKKDGSIALTFVRDGNRQTVNVTPEEVKGGFDNLIELSTPDAPGMFRMVRPAIPGRAVPAPLPLNRLFFPGRVV